MLAQAPPPSQWTDWLPWLIPAAIVVLGLFVYGIKDIARFRIRRAWAISSVNFAESLRRRVLWITPLAILGCIIVAQLQHPVDEQDAIRQTTKFCLFASGLVVTVTAIILACTNLPREIESRVIYTVVTKPTTRLEIVLGKIIGFARVSAAILLIMGVFTFAYLQFRSWRLGQFITQRLELNQVDALSRPSLEHYKESGLLAARVYDRADDLAIMSRVPGANDERRYMFGGSEGLFLVPFDLKDEPAVHGEGNAPPRELGIAINVGYEESDFESELGKEVRKATTLPFYVQNPEYQPPPIPAPPVSVQLLDINFNTLVQPSLINEGKPVQLVDPAGQTTVFATIAPAGVIELARSRVAYVQIMGISPHHEYFANTLPITLRTVDGRTINPIAYRRANGGLGYALPTFQTRDGTYGKQLRGGTGRVPIAIFKFRDAQIEKTDGKVAFELRVGIERALSTDQQEEPTELDVVVQNRGQGGAITGVSETIKIYPETNRTFYFSLPATAITGRDFDVLVRCRTSGQFVGMLPGSLQLVVENQSFALNLLKSLLILWLLSILVVIVSIFCSTFLSWPIAIVLTLLILLGHWGVMQLGDATAPGIGGLVVQDLFKGADAPTARAINASVEALSRVLNTVTSVLPDIAQFSAIEDMERGMAVPRLRLLDSLRVIAMFGLPMTVLAYIILRNKEVAP